MKLTRIQEVKFILSKLNQRYKYLLNVKKSSNWENLRKQKAHINYYEAELEQLLKQ